MAYLGRPSKLTPERSAEVVGAVRRGLGLREAARRAGVAVSTLGDWIARGRRGEPGYQRLFLQLEWARRLRWYDEWDRKNPTTR